MPASHLAQLAAELERLSAKPLDLRYEVAPPYPEQALVASMPGEQPIVVAPVWIVDGSVKHFGPGRGVPHWEIYFGGLPLSAEGHHLAHTLADAAARILEWWQPRPPIERRPLGAADIGGLRRVAAARDRVRALAAEARNSGMAPESALGVAMQLDGQADWPAQIRERLGTVLARVNVELLLLNLPRPGGRAKAGTVVLLERLEDGVEMLVSRHTWLMARVESGGRVRIGLEQLIGPNHPHRWDIAPWLWSTAPEAGEAARWGVSGLPIDAMGLDRRPALARLARSDSEPQRVALSVLMLDDDRVEEALELAGVRTTPRLAAILAGTPAGADRFLGEHVSRVVRDLLRGSAPWRFRMALETGSRVGNRSDRLRLVALPNQAKRRKASLVLTARSGSPVLDVENTGSNARLPEPLWLRPLDLELRRFGLE